MLRRFQFQKLKLNKDVVRKITCFVGLVEGCSKTTSVWCSAIGKNPTEICVWNEKYIKWFFEFFKNNWWIYCYSDVVALDIEGFLPAEHQASQRPKYFKRKVFAKTTFMSIVSSACVVEGINGRGSKSWETIHGLRGTLATLLFESGQPVSPVSLRSRPWHPHSLKGYQHLCGGEGRKQKRDISEEEEPVPKRLTVMPPTPQTAVSKIGSIMLLRLSCQATHLVEIVCC